MNYSDIAKSKIGLAKVENIQFSAVDGLISGYELIEEGSDLQCMIGVGVRSSDLLITRDAAELHDFTANKDTYVYITLASGAKVFTEVDNGEAEPTAQDGDVYIGLVVTDDTAVTSIASATIWYVKSITNEIGVSAMNVAASSINLDTVYTKEEVNSVAAASAVTMAVALS